MYVISLKLLAHLRNILHKSSYYNSQHTLRMSIDKKFRIDSSGLIHIESLYWFYKFLLLQDVNPFLKLICYYYLCSIRNVYIIWHCNVNLHC